MPNTYHVTFRLPVQADNPRSAAHAALERLLAASTVDASVVKDGDTLSEFVELYR